MDIPATREGPQSKPDLVLVGHEENAEFALAVHRESFHVASGGKDRQVLLWDVADHDGGSIWKTAGSKPSTGVGGGGEDVHLSTRSFGSFVRSSIRLFAYSLDSRWLSAEVP